jgi:hypothetical protein
MTQAAIAQVDNGITVIANKGQAFLVVSLPRTTQKNLTQSRKDANGRRRRQVSRKRSQRTQKKQKDSTADGRRWTRI